MSAWIATTLAAALIAATAATPANADCLPRGTGHCIGGGSAIDLNSVSDIASKIVDEEPSGKKQGVSASEPAAPTIYTGPIFGAAGGKKTPTVGYSWSLQ
jgi:hypothetical protein